jgi:general L-amino acid transport system permease protein
MPGIKVNPLVEPKAPPIKEVGVFVRFFKMAFSNIPNAIVTLLLLSGTGYLVIRFIEWGIISAQWSGTSAKSCTNPDGACWSFIIARWKPILAGQYPMEELWRVFVFLGILVLLIAWLVVKRIPLKSWALISLWTLFPVVSFILLVGGIFGLAPVPTNEWGGLLVTVVTAVFTMICTLPFGLMLALGRLSKMPVVRVLCITFVEVVRGIPLLAFLFTAATIFPLVLPEGMNIDLFARTMIAFMIFNGAMTSEVFRGGLQSVRKEQYEAATTIGLGWFTSMIFIILPQAVRTIIPALVNCMIIIIKETSVLLVIGLLDFIATIHFGTESPDWIGGHHILVTGYIFTASVYMITCFSLSKYSRRFERQS